MSDLVQRARAIPPGTTARLFYVTVRDAGRTGFLLGPYSTHGEALANVKRGTRLAQDANSRAVFYAFGTSRWKTGDPVPKTVFGK
jgi:hypothetical protein